MGPLGLGVTFVTLPLVIRAAAGGQWCYDSQDPKCGPSHWKELQATCGGDKQSPVNIDRRWLQRDGSLGDIIFEGYDQAPPGKWRLLNDGHTVMLSLESEPGAEHIAISGGGLPGRYRALQLHFHWGSPSRNGSEHTVDGHQLPMELHIVHMNVKYRTLGEAKGHPSGLAVLGCFFQVSEAANSNYNTIIGGLRNISHAGQAVDLASTFRLDTLLPHVAQLSRYYRYQGSLTTPDCSEAVIWTVFEEPLGISREQLQAFVSTVHFPASGAAPLKMTNNFRPPQPLHSRKIFSSRDATASCGCPRCPLAPLLLLPLLGPFLSSL
ncbi:carbonic anhydrase 15-like [Centrocercus urophasianus]|uniref:carbonic anhydrase 15-like n=1 Tax=Centrocercus urophasianus TaxID=9002 RepID=UPI001C645FC8|nr:carbonic anhydrase 15-like [Centrocercus urophasianus]